jgi:flagellar basal body-associated protein FliL
MMGKEKEEPKGEENEEGEKRKSRTALLAGIVIVFCLILGGIWAIAFFHGKKAIEEKCSQTYSQARDASISFENEKTSATNILNTSSSKSSQAYSDLEKALAAKTDSSPALCSAGTHEAIEANEALIKTLGSKQENLSYLSVSLLSQENVSNLQEEKSLAQEAIKSANSSLSSLSSSSKAEVESRISDLQNELNSQTPSLSGIKDAMLALDGSLKLSQNTK